MGFFSKLGFGKKEDEFDFDKAASRELGRNSGLEMPHLGQDDPALSTQFPLPQQQPLFGQTSSFSQPPSPQSFQQQQSYGKSPDLELINSKLDTLKAMLASLDQRLAQMERTSHSEKKERLW
ncbi:hypothetical protein COV20_05400 [Candidatus Woesearchaeota archaeon CG10_big_fil_rev_8_21_14_0_10_45_16]|nr:MAG: hypothetical protein COV20_05400 [Candidatus Woesearchaeota archaeon CG10_big_fil_rev_8_21_14_0_10_45_16]